MSLHELYLYMFLSDCRHVSVLEGSCWVCHPNMESWTAQIPEDPCQGKQEKNMNTHSRFDRKSHPVVLDLINLISVKTSWCLVFKYRENTRFFQIEGLLDQFPGGYAVVAWWADFDNNISCWKPSSSQFQEHLMGLDTEMSFETIIWPICSNGSANHNFALRTWDSHVLSLVRKFQILYEKHTVDGTKSFTGWKRWQISHYL